MDRIWNDVPDPLDPACPGGGRCTVLLPDHRWQHLSRHTDNRAEPWEEWLTPAVIHRLRSCPPAGTSDVDLQEARQQASDRFELETKQNLHVPLAVLYYVGQPFKPGASSSPLETTCDLVLPSGAKLTIRQKRQTGLTFLTCYFISQVRTVRGDRWRLLMLFLLERYATPNGDGSFSPPDLSRWPQDKEGEFICARSFARTAHGGSTTGKLNTGALCPRLGRFRRLRLARPAGGRRLEPRIDWSLR